MKCPSCGSDNSDGAKICDFCSTPLPSNSSTSIHETTINAPQPLDVLDADDMIANRYKIVRELGRGGMGVVYLVQDQMLQGQEIALKMISSFLVQDEAAHQRFVQEAMSAQSLSHVNIVRAYHFDRFNGQDYFTMEYLPGRSLREWMEERKASGNNFSLKESLDIIQQVLSGLDHAHSQGVIHRDLKPENIAVLGDFPDITVKILDFGLAKVMSLSRLTSAAMTMGTAYYMSPEQLAGKVDVDARSDLFPVGVLLYELIVGEIPIGRFQLPGELVEGIPEEADKVIEKALSPKPGDRYEGARELSESLSLLSEASAAEAMRQQEEEIQRKESEKARQEEAERKKIEVEKKRQAEKEKQRLRKAEKQVNTETFDRLCMDAEKSLQQADFAEAKNSIDKAELIFPEHGNVKRLKEKLDKIRFSYNEAFKNASEQLANKDFDAAYKNITNARKLCPNASKPDQLNEALEAGRQLHENEKNKRLKLKKKSLVVAAAITVCAIIMFFVFHQSEPAKPPAATIRETTHAPATQKKVAARKQKPTPARQQKTTHTASVPSIFSLTIQPEPSNARIRIMNIGPKYQAGMMLKPGKYHIEVSKSGYSKFDQWIELKKSNLNYPVVLKKNTSRANISNSLGMEFVYIKPGTFMMGSVVGEPGRSNDETRHQEILTKGYYLQATEVTQGQWRLVMGSSPSKIKNCGDDCPVEQVSWDEVQDFIRKLNVKEGTNKYRLPMEAEWEYACRGGSDTIYNWGDSTDCSKMMYENNAGSTEDNCVFYRVRRGLTPDSTAPVGSYPANAFGLYDMHGNVWEWCSDWYGDYASGSINDHEGPSSGSYRVYRGGSWENGAEFCRSAVRSCISPNYRDDSLGFRLAKTP